MYTEELWESAKLILGSMRELIEEKKTITITQNTNGHQYGGDVFRDEVMKFEAEISSRGYKVRGCTTWHFFRGVHIINPTKRLILVPIKGSSNLSPGRPLLLESYYYIEDEPSLLAGEEGIDILFIVIEPEEKRDIQKDTTLKQESEEDL